MQENKQKQLIKSAINGEQKAIKQLYEQYVEAMYNTCLRMVGNNHDADDIIQDSFISAFNNLHKFKKDAMFGAWLKRIVVNKTIDFLRAKRYDFMSIDDVNVSDSYDEEEEIPKIDFTELSRHIKELPEKARMVFNLYLLEGYKHKEIAEMLGISESTSKSQYIRAKQLLQEKIKKR